MALKKNHQADAQTMLIELLRAQPGLLANKSLSDGKDVANFCMC